MFSKPTATLLMLAMVYAISCAPTKLPQSGTPAWDSGVPLDSGNAEPPSLSDKLTNILSDDNNDYHFRKVRWGFNRERVELSEAGNTVFERRGNAVVYKCELNGVDCKLIYTFKNNRLRAAGYVTINPIPKAENLIKNAVDKHGMPDTHNRYPDGLEEMVWKRPDTVIFTNLSPTVTKATPTKYEYSNRGLLKDVLKNRPKAGVITYYDGVYAHVDPAFFAELHEVDFPAAELSFYEKQLMGVLLKSKRTIIPGLGTIPQ